MPRLALFLPVPTGGPKEYSEETARLIYGEIHKLLDESRTRVRETLTANRGVLEALEAVAKLLMEQEVVDRQTLTWLLAVEQLA